MNRETRTGFIVCSPFILLVLLGALRMAGVIELPWWWIAAIILVPLAILIFWLSVILIFVNVFHRLMNNYYHKKNITVR